MRGLVATRYRAGMNQRPHVEQLEPGTLQAESSLFPDTATIPAAPVTEAARRPRARRPGAAQHVSPFGGVPQLCTHWGVQKLTLAGAWEAISHPDGTGVRRFEWPLSELSLETLQARWVHGTFRAQWFKPSDNGGRKFLTTSTPITIDPVAASPAEPVAAVPSVSGPQLGEFVAFMDLVSGKAKEQISGMADLARVMAGGAQQGQLTGRDLLDALRDERASAAKTTEAAILAAVQPLQQRLDALTAQQQPGGGGLVAGAAGAAASAFGEGWMGSAMTFAAQQPELAQTIVEQGIPAVKEFATMVLGLFAKAKAAAPQQQQPTQQRPRALAPQQQPAAAAPPAVDASAGSLSGWSTTPANGAGAAPGPVQRTIVVEAEDSPAS